MLKTYLTQTMHLMKEHRLLSLVSVAGTGLSLAMIMTILVAWQVQVAPCEPEINRDRTLSFDLISVKQKEQGQMYSALSPCFVRECLYPLEQAEKVSMVLPCGQVPVTGAARHKTSVCDVLQTDDAFFDIFHFRFLSGRKLSGHDLENSLPVAIVTASVARNLFGSEQVCGQTIRIMNSDLKIIGVVKDVSELATQAYAQVWIPWNFRDDGEVWNEPWGGMVAYILMNRDTNRDELNREIGERIRKFTLAHPENLYEVSSTLERPLTAFESLFLEKEHQDTGEFYVQGKTVPDVSGSVMRWGIVIAILLIVPAINLSGLTFSRLHERMAEFGVRKAFGAGRSRLVGQVLAENMVTTLLGGVLGVALSFLFVRILKEWLLDSSVWFTSGERILNADMLLHPVIFLYAFLICLLLNLLSAGIPAWLAAKSGVINALNGKL